MVVSECVNPKLVFNDDYDAETEVSLDEMLSDKTIEDLEMSSREDLLNLDANRPCSSGRKSVTFSDFIDVEIISPQIVRKVPTISSVSLVVKPILKKEDEIKESTRKMIDSARDRLYKDLQMLVEVRDRTIQAIESTNYSDRSAKMGAYQTRFHEKLLSNKALLDSKIEQVWQKLTEVPLEEAQAEFVFSVENSEDLTVDLSRKVASPRHYTSCIVNERKERKERNQDNLTLASNYASKLYQLRGNLIRRDSEIRRSDEKSVVDIVSRVSRALQSYDKN